MCVPLTVLEPPVRKTVNSLIIDPDTIFTSICVPDKLTVPFTVPELDLVNVIVPGMVPAPGVNENSEGSMFRSTVLAV